VDLTCLAPGFPYGGGVRIVLIAAQSLDGFITRHDEPGTAFTSPEDKTYFREVLGGFDAGVLGGQTYRVSRDFIRAHLPGRLLRVVLTRTPDRYAADAVPGKLEFSSAEPAGLAAELRRRGCRQCAVLGGSHVHSLFLAAGLVDEVWLTIEPALFGGGTPLLARRAIVPLALQSAGKLGPHTLLVKYDVVR
jgi:dihydrofolate reductase